MPSDSTSTYPVRKAILPSAGLGTRMRPYSWVLPKELVPLGSVPALHFVLDEIIRAGLTEVAIVTRPGKPLLAEHLGRAQDEGHFSSLDIAWVEQPEPLGLGDAILQCRSWIAGEPFALLWPDNVVLTPGYDFGPLVRLYAATGLDVFGLLELGTADSERFSHTGLFRHQDAETWEGRRRVRILELFDKRPGRLKVEPGQTLLRTTGRIVTGPELLDAMEASRSHCEGELDEVPAFQKLIRQREAWGLLLGGQLFDTGHPAGVLAASAYLHDLSRGTP